MTVLADLRRRLKDLGLNGFLVPHADRHQSEHVPASEQRLRHLTGFTGSAGLAVVLTRRAALFVDGRYELQAGAQVNGAEFDILFLRQQTPEKWIAANLPKGATLAYDPWLHTDEQVERLEKAASEAGGRLTPVVENPLDAVWTLRPAAPASTVERHSAERFAGESAPSKRKRLTQAMKRDGVDAVALTAPESICWLFNIRGDDVEHTPLVLAFALLRQDGSATVFSDPGKFSHLRGGLGKTVKIASWADFEPALRMLAGKRVAVERSSAPAAVSRSLREAQADLVWRADPCVPPRSRKNAVEIEGARAAHRRDGAALATLLAWLDAVAPSGELTELAVAEQLRHTREDVSRRLDLPMRGESFGSIVGFRGNGAIVHYRVTRDSDQRIDGDGLLLIDSGGQYQDGTTDVTRTVAIGAASAQERLAATLVLKGMIAISMLWFPPGARGCDIDALARAPLWRAGLDYDHGTGHGVGSFLSVHEGPIGISKRVTAAFEPGMILSNEPGCYRAGAFGVRIENLLLVSPPATPEGGDRPMLSFENLTLAPIDRRLIDRDLLTPQERAWLDAYHARVRQEIGPLLAAGPKKWLKAACAPL